MICMFVLYAVLSATDRTWFFRLTSDNVLMISDFYYCTADDTRSVKFAYAASIINGLRLAQLDLEVK